MKKLLLLTTTFLLLSFGAFAEETDTGDGSLCDTERQADDIAVDGAANPVNGVEVQTE